MKNTLTIAAILLAIWTGSAAAQSAVGGPKKQSNLGGPNVQKNPVVRTTPGGAATLPPSPPKQAKKK
ncbi:hypothetical protein [Bradyrhizobium genosp. P]|uniref:hypothetical protein n=1 Tax=Bradyrhizobium genosp. P TaxID=83641 RepID=UPI003CE8285E